jgi:hypothetical protein
VRTSAVLLDATTERIVIEDRTEASYELTHVGKNGSGMGR